MAELLTNVPVNVVTGALGVGKTTALIALLEQAPPTERWAVLINEFGEVGIDGAVVAARGGAGLQVREVAGGCICCTAGLELRTALVRLLREVRPDRLLIEPSGVAHPAAVIDALRSEGLRQATQIAGVITLVDPRAFLDPVRRNQDAYADQVLLADVLVANRTDQCSPEELQRFEVEAAALFPPKLRVEQTSFGRLDPAWLDVLHQEPTSLVIRRPHVAADVNSHGWVWPADVVFDRGDLEDALQTLVRPNKALPSGVLRLKGVFRTPRVVLLVQGTADTLRMEGLNWRRDSRLEILAPAGDADWDAVDHILRQAQRKG
jgi:G3E family GTPase